MSAEGAGNGAPETSAASAVAADGAPAGDGASSAPTGNESAPTDSVPREASTHGATDSPITDSPATDGAANSEGGPAAETEAQGADGDKPKKKRRRRRRKKKGAATEPGTTAAPEDAEAAKKSTAPYIHLFEGVGKRHAFAAGETVAGRVADIKTDSILVDLFGKATAVVDIHEPQEIEPLPESTASGEVEAPPTSPGAEDEHPEADPGALVDGEPAVVVAPTVSITDHPPAPEAGVPDVTIPAAGSTANLEVRDSAGEGTEGPGSAGAGSVSAPATDPAATKSAEVDSANADSAGPEGDAVSAAPASATVTQVGHVAATADMPPDAMSGAGPSTVPDRSGAATDSASSEPTSGAAASSEAASSEAA
ncbi:MAG: hypothetical protein AAGF12_10220 [Myxococcota bacterium]